MPINNVPVVSVVSPTSYTTASSGLVALTANTASVVRPALATRRYVAIVNNSASDVTLVLGPATGLTVGTGIILKGGGGSFELQDNGGSLYVGAISAISASAVSIAWVEANS